MVLSLFHPHVVEEDDSSNEIIIDTSNDVRYSVIIGYIILIIIWIVMIYILSLAPWTLESKTHGLGGLMGWIVFIVPIFMMFITIIIASKADNICSLTQNLTNTNTLTIVILLSVPVLSILDLSYQGNRRTFMQTILASMVLAVLTNIDIYGVDDWKCVVDHIKSGMRTISLGLLLYVIALYANNGKYFAAPRIENSPPGMVKIL